MRIYTENTENFIQTLAIAISKDPASLENWQCLHIKHHEGTLNKNREEIIRHLKMSYANVDCDAIQCSDNDVLFISKANNSEQLDEIANEFTREAFIEEGCIAECTLYDLFRDWRSVRELLLAKVEQPEITPIRHITHDFSSAKSLVEVFSEAKKLRKERPNLRIMVVDDDSVTRRIVTGAFKNEYALVTAANAQEAVSNYLLHAPDIVFLDIGLPDASGFEVLYQIMASDADAYVVMFSGNSYLDNITTALSSGAAGFIAKPFKKGKMRQYINDSALHHHKNCA